MGSCSCQVSAVIEINRKEEENSIISKRLLSPTKEREKEIDIKSIIEEQKKNFQIWKNGKGINTKVLELKE